MKSGNWKSFVARVLDAISLGSSWFVPSLRFGPVRC